MTSRKALPVGAALAVFLAAAVVPAVASGIAIWAVTPSALSFFDIIAAYLISPLLPGVLLLPLLCLRSTRGVASNGLAALGLGSVLGKVGDLACFLGTGADFGLWFRLPFYAMVTVLVVSLLVELRSRSR